MTLLNETLLSITQASRLLPSRRGNDRVSPCTVWRWLRDGIILPDGTRLRLESVRIGSGYLTSREAIDRFVIAQTEAHRAADDPAPPAPRTPTARARASERASKKLESMGI